MRVLQVIDSLAVGGAERLLVDLCPLWRAKGIEVDVFVLRACKSPNEAQLRELGFKVFTSSSSSLYSPMQAAQLFRHIRTHGYDIVHVHLYPAQLWVAAIRRGFPHIRFISTEHSTWNRRRDLPVLHFLERWMYQSFDYVACISSATETRLFDWLGSYPGRTVVLPNGVDLTRLSGPRLLKSDVFGNDAPAILCIGSLKEVKDQATLLKAAALLPDVHVWLAGDGPLRPSLQAIAKSEGIDDRVHFLGISSDVPRLIAAADIYVQPSRVEGFGLAAVEAMAGRLPVICSDIPGLRDVVGSAGLLFEPGNHPQLTERIQTLLNDPQLRQKMSTASVERAQHFSLEITADRYLAIYRDLCGESPNTQMRAA